MSSVPPARRPRPGPGIAARPAARPAPRPRPQARGTVVLGGEKLRVPGLAALLHRHPKLTRRGAVAAIAGGVALFVTASVAPLAGADVAHRVPQPAHIVDPAWLAQVPLSTPTPTPVEVRKVLPAKPVHVAHPAPVNHGVISGLAANGIPVVALNAYRVGAARMDNAVPGCGIDWALLAGIGREESDHGQFGGAVLHADGVSTPKIIGPALDGIHYDYIPAPPNGLALDGDARYAHALGPMQFIPSTWAIYGTDGNGDGKADIFNIYDAALSAARYLCAAGGNLRVPANQVRAVLAYNHSDQYVAQVLALAAAYRQGIPITGIPVGITTGALPKVRHTGTPPPANPGAPTAAGGTSTKATHKTTPTSSPSRSTTPTHSTSTPPGSHSTAPASSSTPPKSGGSGSTSPTPTPTPSPTKTCNPLQVLLGCKPS